MDHPLSENQAVPTAGLPVYEPYRLDRQTAPSFWLVGVIWSVLASGRQTNNRFTLLEQLMPGGLGPPTHRHPTASEGFYILEGTCTFNAQGKSVSAGPGTFVHIPRLLPHSFSVDTPEARVLNFYLPACFELVVMALGQPALEQRRPTASESAPTHRQDQIRILSGLYGQDAVTALPFEVLPTPALMTTWPDDVGVGSLLVVTENGAPASMALGSHWRTLITAIDTEGRYDLFVGTVPVGSNQTASATDQDKAIYVLTGTLTLILEGELYAVRSGTFAYVPLGRSVAWQADTEDVRLLLFHLPGGESR